jgi:hypothetical protein
MVRNYAILFLLMAILVVTANKPLISGEMRELWRRSHADWVYFSEKILNVNLDDDQKRILRTIQNEPRVSVRSGNARGKDFVAAVASNCWLHLYRPSKVVNTAPTGRQVESIMMTEIARIRNGARVPLGGRLLQNHIKFDDDPDHFLIAFKASDTADETWTGFHSPNLMVVVTEASGVEDRTHINIEKILTGNSRLLIVFNPVRAHGEAFRSIKDPRYKSFRLNCLDAPNVKAKRIIIPGQVDWNWVNGLIHKPGMVTAIDAAEVRADLYDFQWEGQWYRPSDLFLVMVIGEPPREQESQLIPYAWIQSAIERWHERKGTLKEGEKLSLGADIAGMGADKTSLIYRYGTLVQKIQRYPKSDHMATAGRIVNILTANPGGHAFVDTIGEGAGVYSRLAELAKAHYIANDSVTSAKFSEGAKGKKDFTGIRTFANMRAYCLWAVRDALDPSFNSHREPLALPPDDDLVQELCEHHWDTKSNGDIYIEEKDEIKARLGRSPDDSDALALSYFPKKVQRAQQAGAFDYRALGLPG